MTWNRTSTRLASLDGLRAVSIGLVVLFHLGVLKNSMYGNLGVRIFFVISGYLITGLLFEEWNSTGQIQLRNFYVRRVFRIFPAFYAYIAFIAILAASGLIQLAPSDMLQAASYTVNYFPGLSHSLYVRHIWSLAVEEQFYLVWPVLICLAGRRRALGLAAGMLLLAPAVRIIYWLYVPSLHNVLDSRFETVADALAAGCVLAGIQSAVARYESYNAALRSRWFFLLPAFTFVFAGLASSHPRLYYGCGITVLNISIAICIDRFIRYPQGMLGRILNSQAFCIIGILSYSIYLWQQPFLDWNGSSLFQQFPLNLAAAAIFSAASYFLIEQPFLRLRKKLFRREIPKREAVIQPA